MTTRSRSDRGAVALELVLLVPVLMMLVGLVVGSARIWTARATVDEAAHRGARTATVLSDARSAVGAAEAAARANLVDVPCRESTVSVDASALHRPPGTPGTVGVTVGCTVTFSDLVLPGLPGELTLQANAASAVDRYRGR
ncbi:TadE/TadG family type IV pilus assembly protein [Raineyella sp. LH-20]|uniref:TadE/TadG family type IV pilus assembly protein n=1 Tax=Raineyella sp. LH-20 TaxID=3081204 RepID=UPI002954231F|nr:TadE/TadG family type IV pilus assembly protein [Raineyella sp. LH-20]WOP19627.1 TadE/TadG family type IV pilus assembly protein [Raineyella sp. LH-20]